MADKVRVEIQITREDREKFDAVQEALGLSSTSELIRFLVRREHRSLELAPAKAKGKKR